MRSSINSKSPELSRVRGNPAVQTKLTKIKTNNYRAGIDSIHGRVCIWKNNSSDKNGKGWNEIEELKKNINYEN